MIKERSQEAEKAREKTKEKQKQKGDLKFSLSEVLSMRKNRSSSLALLVCSETDHRGSAERRSNVDSRRSALTSLDTFNDASRVKSKCQFHRHKPAERAINPDDQKRYIMALHRSIR